MQEKNIITQTKKEFQSMLSTNNHIGAKSELSLVVL